jgi:hypothetical protein
LNEENKLRLFYFHINNIDKVQYEQILPLSQTTTRGHSKKLYKKNCRTNVRKYNVSQRVVDEWNKIPKKVIDSNNQHFQEPIEQSLNKSGYKIFTIYPTGR